MTLNKAAVIMVGIFLLFGCIEADTVGGEDFGLEREGHQIRQQAANVPGPWVIPPEVEAAGELAQVEYTGGGPWNNGAACAGGMTPGAAALRTWILEHWPQVDRIGGYRCTEVDGTLSLHGTGRALDVMIPTINGEADNTSGDALVNWLILHAEEIGIQRIIWDRWNWHTGRSPRSGPYNGTHPHHDHPHVELSVAGAAMQTPWFNGPMGPPDRGGCGSVLPSQGGVIDNDSSCFQAFGPSAYWRPVDGAGHGAGYLWTNAFEAAQPSNWARWYVELEEAGKYLVEFYAEEDHAVFDRVRYDVRHGGRVTEVVVDQSQGSRWRRLGEFEFDAGRDQWVSIYDNYDFAVAPGQHITADALRLTRVDTLAEEPEEEFEDELFDEPGADDDVLLDDDGQRGGDDSRVSEEMDHDDAYQGGVVTTETGCAVGAGAGHGPGSGSGLFFLLLGFIVLGRGRGRGRVKGGRTVGER